MPLSSKRRYLQVALNSSLSAARSIIAQLPRSERIIIEAGTPFIKCYGIEGIRRVCGWWQAHFWRESFSSGQVKTDGSVWRLMKDWVKSSRDHDAQNGVLSESQGLPESYVVADMKCMDRGGTEVKLAAQAGASAVTVLGTAPVETIEALIQSCRDNGIDSVIDMMNVERPYRLLTQLRHLPTVVMLHRGVDETRFGDARFPIHLINKVKGYFNVMVAVGGGDTIREVQSAVFNGADIVMVWKEFYQPQDNTAELAEQFLKSVK